MAVDAPTPVGSSTSRTAVTGAIRQAARVTGVSFDYLLATAKVESDLNPNLTMRTSSATGLFQFIEQTWLATLKQGGPAFGYGDYADAISRTPAGRYVVDDPALRNEIMQLRKDPTANALMGGAVTQKNATELAKRIGRKPTEGELYVAHFFGPYAGAKADPARRQRPDRQCRGDLPGAGGRQPFDLLRPAGQCAQHRRGLRRAHAALSGGARRSRARVGAAGRRQHPAPAGRDPGRGHGAAPSRGRGAAGAAVAGSRNRRGARTDAHADARTDAERDGVRGREAARHQRRCRHRPACARARAHVRSRAPKQRAAGGASTPPASARPAARRSSSVRDPPPNLRGRFAARPERVLQRPGR